jgi:hypothetical protein
VAEREVDFNSAFRVAGGVRRRESVPYPLTHDSIRNMCVQRERILRIQFEDERFSDEDEQVLASLSVDDPDQAFLRFKHLCGLWFLWEKGYRGGAATAEDRDAARWLMLSREPVRIRIAGRVVPVTSRSRAAMIRMHRHEAARAICEEKLQLIERRQAETGAAARAGTLGVWRALGRRRRLRALAARWEQEWQVHFRGILANALTADGRAALPDEAPEWWDQVTPEDEARILVALFEAGPGRMVRGRKPAPRGGDPKKKRDQEMTFGALLRYWEPKLKLPPMGLEDTDLAQLMTAIEDGAGESAAAQELEEVLS